MHDQKWKNFQGLVGCSERSDVYCPTSVTSLQQIMRKHDDVRVIATGHSWNQIPCLKPGGKRQALISTYHLDEVRELDETNLVVKVEAAVTTRELMNWLRKRGYVLPSVPFWIDQTVAGAIATNTHGAELRPGMTTMSDIARAISFVTADGSLRTLRQGQDDEALRAARVSVGKLGAIYEVEMAVQKDYCVFGSVPTWSDDEFLAWLGNLKKPNATDYIQPADHLALQQFWFPNMGKTIGNVRRIVADCKAPPAGAANFEGDSTYSSSVLDTKMLMQVLRNIRQHIPEAYEYLEASVIEESYFCKGVCHASQRQIVPSSAVGETAPSDWYKQYEWAVPLDKAQECFTGLFNEVLAGKKRRLLLAAPVLLRYVGKDESYLSFTNDGPRIFANMNIDLDFRTHGTSECSVRDQLMQHMVGPSCNGRMHWGKTGWDGLEQTDAKAMYPEFDAFETVRKEWDPTGKFVGDRIFNPQMPPQPQGKCTGSLSICKQPERMASQCLCTATIPGLTGWFSSCKWQIP